MSESEEEYVFFEECDVDENVYDIVCFPRKGNQKLISELQDLGEVSACGGYYYRFLFADRSEIEAFERLNPIESNVHLAMFEKTGVCTALDNEDTIVGQLWVLLHPKTR